MIQERRKNWYSKSKTVACSPVSGLLSKEIESVTIVEVKDFDFKTMTIKPNAKRYFE